MAHLFETHVTVSDLDRSMAFYRDVVGLELANMQRERGVAFFWIGERGQSMLGVWAAGASPNAMRLHFAIRRDLHDVLAAPAALRHANITPLDFFRRPTNEPSVIAWLPAASVFFEEPDGHLPEYLAMLPHEPKPQAGVVTYGEWLEKWVVA
jgi:lactoylglutathione lyase